MEAGGNKWYEVKEMVDSMLPVSTKTYGDCVKSINYLQQVKAQFCYYMTIFHLKWQRDFLKEHVDSLESIIADINTKQRSF